MLAASRHCAENKRRTLKTLKFWSNSELQKEIQWLCLCWSFLQGEKLTLQRETFSVLILWVAPTYSSMNLNSWLLNNMKNDQENHGQQLKENESELLEVQEHMLRNYGILWNALTRGVICKPRAAETTQIPRTHLLDRTEFFWIFLQLCQKLPNELCSN